MSRPLDKDRYEALSDAWNEIVARWDSGESLGREDAAAMLRRLYEAKGVSPIRGSAEPSDLYDKELTSLYVIGKYGMGLDQQYREQFETLFALEERIDEAVRVLEEGGQGAREKVKALLGEVDGNAVARILRMVLTKIYFGFEEEASMRRAADALLAAFPERANDVTRFLKFYTAFKVAMAIKRGDVRDRITKEALKHATAVELGKGKEVLPGDNYIATIAREVFKVPARTLRDILALRPPRPGPARS